MDNNFTVTEGNKNAADIKRIKRVIVNYDAWMRQYFNTVNQLFDEKGEMNNWTQHDLMKFALQAVKYINAALDIKHENMRENPSYDMTLEEKKKSFALIDSLFGVIGRIKLKNLIKVFPVTKDFDGAKYECKDYFYTMNILREKGLDNAVGRDNVFELLWDYQNDDLWDIFSFFLSCMSTIHREQTSMGIAEEFFSKQGVSMSSIDFERGIMVDDNGKISKISNKPSYLQVVK